jgi:hypothetical protein
MLGFRRSWGHCVEQTKSVCNRSNDHAGRSGTMRETMRGFGTPFVRRAPTIVGRIPSWGVSAVIGPVRVEIPDQRAARNQP